jgi:hypothetical protein
LKKKKNNYTSENSFFLKKTTKKRDLFLLSTKIKAKKSKNDCFRCLAYSKNEIDKTKIKFTLFLLYVEKIRKLNKKSFIFCIRLK